MYRWRGGELEVFLVHPGGPFWANKDVGVWTIPKGEFGPNEEPIDAAKREFMEETGFALGTQFHELGTVRQAGGKFVSGWAFEGDADPDRLVSNTCRIQWPPRSGQTLEIPEIDRGRWFKVPEARTYLKDTQGPFLDRLLAIVAPNAA
jgi:predicted NUDIX family NTP pyrophosphohydrolase